MEAVLNIRGRMGPGKLTLSACTLEHNNHGVLLEGAATVRCALLSRSLTHCLVFCVLDHSGLCVCPRTLAVLRARSLS